VILNGYDTMKKKIELSTIVNILIVVVWIYFFVLCPLGFKDFPLLFVAVIVSWVPLLILIGIFGIIIVVRSDRFLKHNHFELWRKTKSTSFREKSNAQHEIRHLGLLDSIKSPRFHFVITFLNLVWVVIALSILIFVNIKLFT
jgi:hypothetical protein